MGLVALHVLAKTDSLLGAGGARRRGGDRSGRRAPVRACSSGARVRQRPGAGARRVPPPLLVGSSVSKLVFVESAEATTVAGEAPVVLIVFDELATVSLMDGNGRLDAARYSAFASLARDATWYRNATTVHAHTTKAVPAILDGRVPSPGQLPTLADHPRNLFTLLAEELRPG